MDKTALVLGATGGIGGEMVRQLVAAGWQVRALTRGATPSPRGDNIEWLHGDALSRADVLAAAKGCAVIVHAVNPPVTAMGPAGAASRHTISAAIAKSHHRVCRQPLQLRPRRFPLRRKTRRSARSRAGAIRLK